MGIKARIFLPIMVFEPHQRCFKFSMIAVGCKATVEAMPDFAAVTAEFCFLFHRLSTFLALCTQNRMDFFYTDSAQIWLFRGQKPITGGTPPRINCIQNPKAPFLFFFHVTCAFPYPLSGTEPSMPQKRIYMFSSCISRILLASVVYRFASI